MISTSRDSTTSEEEPRYLLDHRWRVSRQLEKWLAKITEVIEQSTTDDQPPAAREDYVRAMERIALGRDPTASVRDRLSALKELLKEEPPEVIWHELQPIMHVHPDEGVIRAVYDEEGNLISFVSLRIDGTAIKLERDTEGRWVETTRPHPHPPTD